MSRLARPGVFVLALLTITPGLWTVAATALESEGPPSLSASPAPGRAPSLLLRMKAETFDPATQAPRVPAPLLAPSSPAAQPAGADGRVRFILQFEAGVNPALIAALRPRGIAYERYLPEGGMIASATPGDAPASAAEVGARALLPLFPAFRLDPALWGVALNPGQGTVALSALLFDSAAGPDPLEKLGDVLAFDGRFALLKVREERLLALARLPDLEWAERASPREPLLNYTTRIMSARQALDGPFLDDGFSVWSYNPATDAFEGLNGTGVTINIADTGIDSTHPAFDGRIVGAFGYGSNATCDCTPGQFPHGTLVASAAAGNGSWRAQDADREKGKHAGVAPSAGLVAQVIFGSLRTPTQMAQDALSAGAFINSNSWGGDVGGAYTLDSQQYDELVLDANGRDAGAPQMVYVFASGNSGGGGAQTVHTPGTAKNVITVGATGNVRWSSPDSVAGFSSRGPAADGRLKPDVVAPGEGVDGARAADAGCGGGEDNCSYWVNSGTSFSTPAVAGAVALLTQWFQRQFGTRPSAAMAKALLIEGATPLPGYDWPDNNQGWGRVNVRRSVDESPSHRHLFWDELDPIFQGGGGSEVTYRFFAEAGEELKVVLVWSDVAGTASSGKALINDLDLEVRRPDGTRLYGNAFENGFSTAGGLPDRGNNTEVVRVRAAQRGEWTVRVNGSAVPSGVQRFALLATGNITRGWVSLVPDPPEVFPPSPREDDLLTVIVPVRNHGTAYPAPFDVVAVLEGPEGNATASARVLGVRPGDDFPATFLFAPKRGAHTVRVTVDPGGASGDALTGDNDVSAPIFVAGFQVQLAPVKNITSLPPLGSDSFLLAYTNEGNVKDRFTFAYGASPGWVATLNASAVDLGPGESAFASGTLGTPDRVLAGQTASLWITATSTGNSSVSDRVEFTVTVAALPSSRVTQREFVATADPGSHVPFEYGLENAGNIPLNFEIRAAFSPEVPAPWQVTPALESLSLAPYSAATGRILVSVPADARAAEVRSVLLEVTSLEEALTTPLLFVVSVNRIYGVELGAPPPGGEGAPGDTLAFPVNVRNLGNGRESVALSVRRVGGGAQGVYFSVENATLLLPPFGDLWATAFAELRAFASNGSVEAEVTVEPAGGAPLRLTVLVTVTAVHRVEAQAPARVVLAQGGSAITIVSLENLGNTGEAIGLLVEEVPPGISVAGWQGTTPLALGETFRAELRFGAEAGAAPGNRVVRLVARPAGAATFEEVVVSITVEVRAAEQAGPGFLPGFEFVAAALALGGASLAGRFPRRRT